MDTIELGECPFCGGVVTVGIGTPTGGDAPTVSLADRPECENGCPVGEIGVLAGQTVSISDGMDAAEKKLAREWEWACETLVNPEPCPICGGHPEFLAGKSALRFGCQTHGSVKRKTGMTLAELVGKWDGWSSGTVNRMSHRTELKKECRALNRVYWPD